MQLAAASEYYLQIEPVQKQQLEKLTRLVSIDKIDGTTVFAYANQKELDFLGQSEFSYHIIPGPLAGFQTQMATSADQMRDWDYYPTYETYVELMYQFAADHPAICEVYSIGNSNEGREIIIAHIGDDIDEESDEPAFYYIGQFHGNELVGSITLMHLIDDLLNGYGSDVRIYNIINGIDLYINPLANPDGLYAGGNNTVTGATRGNAYGIDLNRNYPDPEDGAHPDGNEYQAETIIQMEYAAEHHFVVAANLHAGTEVVNYPWDTWATLHADDDWWQLVSHAYADAAQEVAPADYFNEFDDGITNGYDWYTISGGYQDYANWFQHSRHVTLELSDVNAIPENQLQNYYYWNYNSLLLLIEECYYGVRGIITDPEGNPLAAKIFINDHDLDNSEVYANPVLGNYYRPVYAGNYDFQFSCWGYVTQEINLTVPHHDMIVQDVVLQPAALADLSGIITDEESGFPVFGAWIELCDTPLPAVMTNGSGEYSLSDIPAGEYELLIYAGGYISRQESITIDPGNNMADYTLSPTDAISFEAGVFSQEFDFSFTGNADWFITDTDHNNGIYSARSGVISDYQITTMLLTVDLVADGNISFWKKVSSENNYDFLYFYTNNVRVGSWSGSVNWSQQTYNLAAGTNILKWEYDKDYSESGGSDCAWIDDILITGLPETGLVFGDVDNNGFIEAYDASLIQRYSLEMNPGPAAPLPWQNWRVLRADVDANGYIEAYDAALILQYYVGIIEQFPAE
jgi:hypothetical protein